MQRQKLHMTPEAIIRYLLNLSEELDTIVTCRGNSVEISTTDQHLYEAVASIPDKTKINYPRLVKLLEVADIHHSLSLEGEKRHIITPDYANSLYKHATKSEENKRSASGRKPGRAADYKTRKHR